MTVKDVTFECDCGFKTDSQGRFNYHLSECNIEKWLEEKEKLTHRMHKYLHEFLLSIKGESDFAAYEWDKHGVHYEYWDGEDYESISLWVEYNRYLVARFHITIEVFNRENEAPFPEACHDCIGSDCDYYEEEGCKLDSTEELEEWRSFKFLNGGHFTIGTAILDRECHLNFTHRHYYKGFTLTLVSSLLDEIRAFIYAVDFLIPTYERYLDRIKTLKSIHKVLQKWFK